MGHFKQFCPKTVPGPARWHPCDDETRGQSESSFKPSAYDIVSSVAKEVVSCGMCKTGNKVSVDQVIESDVLRSNGGQFWQKDTSCADSQVGSQCELSIGM